LEKRLAWNTWIFMERYLPLFQEKLWSPKRRPLMT